MSGSAVDVQAGAAVKVHAVRERHRVVRPWAARLAPPVAVFLAMRLVIARAVGSPLLGFDASRWARWDSTYYQWIARYGYFHGRSCTGLTPHPVFKDARSCSDVAWYPGYSYLSRILHGVSTLSLPTTALLLAAIFSLANLIVIWVLFLKAQYSVRNVLCLIFAAFFFGVVYTQALFPISMFVFFALQFAYFMERRRWALAAICVAVAVLTYQAGLALMPAAVVWFFLQRSDLPVRSRAIKSAVFGATSAVGLLAFLAIQQIQTGNWAISFQVERGFGTHLSNPLQNLWRVVVEHSTATDLYAWNAGIPHWTAVQTAAVAALVLVIGVWLLKTRGARSADDWGLALMCGLLWLLPLMTFVETGLYRREATLMPIVLLARRLPTKLLLAFTIAAVATASPVAHLFPNHLV